MIVAYFEEQFICRLTPLIIFPIVYLSLRPQNFRVHSLDWSPEDDFRLHSLIEERDQSFFTSCLIFRVLSIRNTVFLLLKHRTIVII